MNVHSNLTITLLRSRQKEIDISVISLLSAEGRRQATSTMLEGGGLDWRWFDAHTALGCEELEYDEERARLRFGRGLTRQEIAVFSSHYGVWKEFLAQGRSEYLLVMEDDLILDTDFPVSQFASFCGKLGMDYVRLFGKHYAQAVKLGFFFDRSVLRYRSSPAGTQAYLLSVVGARKLVEHCRNVDATIDLVMDRFWDTGLPIYSVFPYPVIERFAPTSIPIPSGEGGIRTRAERLRWDFHRAERKFRKMRADRKLSKKDDRLRRQMPEFRQIGN
jgi:glycosyl transferase, family 25